MGCAHSYPKRPLGGTAVDGFLLHRPFDICERRLDESFDGGSGLSTAECDVVRRGGKIMCLVPCTAGRSTEIVYIFFRWKCVVSVFFEKKKKFWKKKKKKKKKEKDSLWWLWKLSSETRVVSPESWSWQLNLNG